MLTLLYWTLALALAFVLLQIFGCFDPDGFETARRKLRLIWRRWLLCTYRGRHEPVRVPLGWRCVTCTRALADLGEAHLGDGYVATTRRIFSRANGGEVTTTSVFEPTRRGL
jgi:hypothetical protein